MTNSITLELSTLRHLLGSTLPFAAKPVGLPILEAVELRGAGGYLIATATDRYVFGIQRTKINDASSNDGEGFYAVLSAVDAKHILSTFKPAKGSLGPVITLTIDDQQLRVARVGEAGMFAGADDLTASYTLVTGDYPKITKLLAEWKQGTPDQTFFNPRNLARFSQVISETEAMRLLPGEGSKATLVLVGADFLGAVMPLRPDNEPAAELLLPGWIDSLNAAPLAEKAA